MKQIVILLADDNFGDHGLVSMALEDSGLGTKLVVATDGDQATNYLWRRGTHANAERPDFVILDLNLPRKTGPEILSEIRNEPSLKGLPIAIMTGAKVTGELAALCRVNANFYILKPDNAGEYFAIIKGLEEYCRNMAASPTERISHAEKLRLILPVK